MDTKKKEYPNHTNEKLLEVRKPFLEKVFGRRRQKLAVDLGHGGFLMVLQLTIDNLKSHKGCIK
jgi:hypothetical protein